MPVYQEGAVDNDLLVEGKRNLTDYFQNQGYYDVDVDFRILPLKDDVESIEYSISRGQRQKLAHAAIVGNRYFSTDDIRERMFMAPASFLPCVTAVTARHSGGRTRRPSRLCIAPTVSATCKSSRSWNGNTKAKPERSP